ncbi:hypothetical protein HY837_00350 [archaeon]|nr:hypothetical protein [archaeon]
MAELLIAPKYKEVKGPVVFLAGPIQGTHSWQEEAIKYFQKKAPHIHIACPRRLKWTEDDEKFNYDEQVDWETHHLNRAAKEGVILFWLANENDHSCDRCYAQTTRFELAEWKVKHERDGVKLVIGIDTKFSGSKYIQKRFPEDCPNVKILDSLQKTCDATILLCK